MDEEKKEVKSTENSGAGNQPEGNGLVDKAYLAAERLENANKKTEELLTRQESLLAKQMLGGRADAGIKPKSPDEEIDEKVKAMIKSYYG